MQIENEALALRALAQFYSLQMDMIEEGDEPLQWKLSNKSAAMHFLEDLFEDGGYRMDAEQIYADMLAIA